jgi:hypothetical protein
LWAIAGVRVSLKAAEWHGDLAYPPPNLTEHIQVLARYGTYEAWEASRNTERALTLVAKLAEGKEPGHSIDDEDAAALRRLRAPLDHYLVVLGDLTKRLSWRQRWLPFLSR